MNNTLPLAAEQEDADAQTHLGVMYELGQGVPQDHQTAVKWQTHAAQQGNAIAQNNLGFALTLGRYIIQYNVYAHMWFNIAQSNGNKKAVANRDSVAERMTSIDIYKAQDLAREWVGKKYEDC